MIGGDLICLGPIEYGQTDTHYETHNPRVGPLRDQPNRPNDRNQEQGNWGFSRSNQGVKRPVEGKEEPEGGGEFNQKRKRM